jgi:4'-phosphopantetheinyl transferase EntD
MIAEILPQDIATAVIQGDFPPAELLAEEALALGRAIDKRQREFAAGRACARQALQQLGHASAPLLRGAQREPLWPAGVVGSITHCAGYCASAVAQATLYRGIGIDAERDEPLPPGVPELVLLRDETAWIAQADPAVHWGRLVFSAKESVYKVWFPLAGTWLDFRDAIVTVDPAAQSFAARLLVQAPDLVPPLLHGRFMIRDGLILTAIALAA